MPRASLILLIAFTAACVSPSASPSPAVPASAAPESSLPASPSPTTFVVPAPTDAPVVRKSLANSSLGHPDPAAELQSVFELIYQARSIRPGGRFDVATLRC